MAKLIKRTWSARGPSGHRVRKVAYGYTVQVPCRPCSHLGKDGAVAHPDGIRQVRVIDADWTKDDAQKAMAAHQLGLKEEQAAASTSLTFGEAIHHYLQAKARKKSIATDKLYLTQFKTAFGAATPLVEITAARISAWKAARLAAVCERTGKLFSAAAINRPLAALRHLLRLAHDEWDVLAEPPKKIRREQEPQGRIRWLRQNAPDEEQCLLVECAKSKNPELVPAVTVALETGLRKGELFGLTWDRVDMSRGVIRLEETKSDRRREVPMRQVVYDALAGLPGPREGRVFKTKAWVFRTAFENAVERAKLADFHWHDLRHHFASTWMMRGGDLLALSKVLGHSKVSMTERYAHLSPDHLRSQVAKTERQTSGFSTQIAHSTPSEPVAESRPAVTS